MDKLNEWLQLNKIGYIISIDDLHNKQMSDTEKIVMLKKGLKKDFEKYSKPFKHIEELWENIENYKDNVDILISIYERLMESKQNIDFIKEMDKLLGGKQKPDAMIQELLNQLENIKEDKNNPIKEFKIYESYEEVMHNYNDFVSNIDNNYKVLWLVDFELEGSKSKRNGVQLIKEILNNKENDRTFIENNIFLILSSQTGESHDLEDIYRRIFVIEKKSLINIVDFTEKMIIGSKSYISSVLVGDMIKRLIEGLRKAKERLLKESLEILDHLMVSYPNQEGTHPLELLLRIFSIVSKSEFEDSITVDIPQVFKLLNEYELMYGEDKAENIKSDFINECFKREKYNININLLYNSINYGDIFRIYNQYYILITQPCDLAIRNNGKRASKYGVLLKIEKGKPQSEFSYPLKYFKEQLYYIDLRQYIYVDLDILDLCTLNKDGYCKLNLEAIDDKYKKILELEEANEEQISAYFKDILNESYIEGYFNKPNKIKLFNVFKKVYKSYKNVNKIKKLVDKDKHDIIEQLINTDDDLVSFNKFSIEGEYIRYHIQRIANLNNIVTSDVISKFSNYISRIGKPGVFAENIERETKKYKIYIEDINTRQEIYIEELNLQNELEIIQEEILKRYNEILDYKKIKQIKPENDRIVITKDLQVVTIDGEKFPVKISKDKLKLVFSLDELRKINGGNEIIASLEQIATGIEKGDIENGKEYLSYYDNQSRNIREKFNFPCEAEVKLANYKFMVKIKFNKEKKINEGQIAVINDRMQFKK